MDALTLFITLILVGGAFTLVLYPLWQRPTRPTTEIDRPGQSLAEVEARYQAALAAIRDLMFDYEMGKIAAEDYLPLLQKAKLHAAQLRQQLNQSGDEVSFNPATDAEIEAAVAALKNNQTHTAPSLQSQVESEIAVLTQKNRCPQCGYTAQPGDSFCAKCGLVLDKNITTRK
jgi:hypothetical protein